MRRAPGGSGSSLVQGRRYSPGAPSESYDDQVVLEEPLEIRIGGDTLLVTMRTPGEDRELAAGLLLSEGIVRSRDDLGSIAHCGRPGDEAWGNTLEVTLAPGAERPLEPLLRRGTLTTAACGVCGRRTVEDLLARCAPLDDDAVFSRDVLAGASERLRSHQDVFARTGGVHAAAVLGRDGTFSCVREDVGRHNAVDKVVGRLLLDGKLPAVGQALVVSGRTSFEIVQKAVVARFPLVLSVSAPTSLAVAIAVASRLTLVAFARAGGFSVYAAPERVD